MSLWNIPCFTASVLGAMCICAVQAESVEPDIPEAYLAGLRRIEAVANPIELTAMRKRRSDLPRRELFRLLGYAQPDPAFFKPLTVTVAHDGGRIFSRVEEARASRDESGAFAGVTVSVTQFAFDGHVVYNWSGERKPAEQSTLFRDTKESLLGDSHPEAELFRTGMLQMLGISLPNAVGELGSPGGSHVLKVFESAQAASSSVTSDGLKVKCELADGTVWSVLVDPQLNFLNRQFEIQYPDSNWIVRRIEGTVSDADAQPVGGELGVPSLVHMQYLDSAGRTLYREDYAISKVSHAPIPDERFVLTDLRPGVTVADGTLAESAGSASERVEYSVPASPEDLERAIEAARQEFAAQHPPSRVSGWRVLLLAAPIIAAVGLLWIFRRRRSCLSRA